MLLALCAVLACLLPAAASAQGASAPGDREQPTLVEQSLPLRTALHHEPTLDAPLQALVKLYRHQNRLEELLSLYGEHLKQWPQDTSARTVHLRLLLAVSDPTALAASRAAVQAQPKHAFFRYLLYRALNASGEEGALDELHQAIEQCEQPQLQREWIDLFLPLASAQGRAEQVTQHLKTLSKLAGKDPIAQLDAARKMMSAERPGLALTTLEEASRLQMQAETSVEFAMTAAKVMAELGQKQDAASRLDRLLDRVSTDYWRRPEIVRQRLGLVDTDAEREKMIQIATERVAQSPGDAAAVIGLADLLVGFERYRSALTRLRAAAEKMPESRALEQATLSLMDRMRDEVSRHAFLQQRLKREPDRRDLRVDLAHSLYLLGRDKEALEQVELAIKGQGEAERFGQLLEAARFLRESALVEPSVPLYARAVKLRPARLDVKRELAEVYLALDQRDKVRGLFAEVDGSEAAIENVLDLADFLIDKQFLSEAMALIEPSVEQLPTHLDLRLLVLRIHGDTAAGRAGNGLIARTRELTDTPARYRRWLEASVEFHLNFDTVQTFLQAEGQRLQEPPDEWRDAAVQRRLAFVEVAQPNRQTDSARGLLAAALNQSPPEAVDRRFRRELLALLDSQRDRAELQQMLSELAGQDDAFRDEANAKLVVMYAAQNRWDLVRPLLAEIDPANIRDLKVLRGLLKACQRIGDHARVLPLMEQMVDLNPTSRSLWENWLQALALQGDESRFRAAVRKLSMGIEKMPLDGDTRERLRTHLLSSYWRSIGRLEQRAEPEAWGEALGLLASAQQVVHEPRELTWIVWMRASMLNRLGREAAREEALFELDRIARRGAEPAGGGADSTSGASPSGKDVVIVFPDGLQVSLAEARRVLTEPPPRDALPDDRRGPVPTSGEVAQRWAFQTADVNIVAVHRGADDQVVITDDAGGLWGVDRANGKLLWHEPGLLPRYLSKERGSGIQAINAAPIRAPQDRLVATDGREVVCVSLRERAVLWRSPLQIATESKKHVPHSADLVIDGAHVVAYDAAAEWLAWFDLGTGKLVETIVLHEQREDGSPPTNQLLRAGRARLSRNGDQLLVIGSTISIVDLAERRVAWRFDPRSAAQFPIKLEAPETEDGSPARTRTQPSARPAVFNHSGQWLGNVPPTVLLGGQPHIQHHRSSVAFHPGGVHPGAVLRPAPTRFVDYQQAHTQPHLAGQTGAYVLTSPVIAWIQQVNAAQGGVAQLLDGRILLVAPGGTVSWSYRNPLGADRGVTSGTMLGVSGRHAVLLQGTTLQRFDTHTHETAQAQVLEVGPMHDGCIDGPATYVAGRDGVAALNTVTGKRLWQHRWSGAEPGQDQSTTPIAQVYPQAHRAHRSRYL
ncbi:MAG: PQQ-binding-like beta-propeller repeat protein, partial [Phycisphaeraceae bacterium]|nr:PQQ-binding-like beta-propeller repeat protein [Phycisphaeraceae bacterium]